MNTQDKITQVYQDAFKDFAVEAPASVQAGALRQLGRKSLLTIDPTRLNIFYMALISGAIAWAIIGTGAEELAQENDSSQLLIENAHTETSQTETSLNSRKTAEGLALQSEKTQPAEVVSEVKSDTDLSKSVDAKTQISNNSKTQEVTYSAPVTESVQIVKNQIAQTVEAAETNSVAEMTEALEELEPIQADLKSTITKLKDPVSLEGARIQRANDLLRQLKLDSDNEVILTVYSGKK